MISDILALSCVVGALVGLGCATAAITVALNESCLRLQRRWYPAHWEQLWQGFPAPEHVVRTQWWQIPRDCFVRYQPGRRRCYYLAKSADAGLLISECRASLFSFHRGRTMLIEWQRLKPIEARIPWWLRVPWAPHVELQVEGSEVSFVVLEKTIRRTPIEHACRRQRERKAIERLKSRGSMDADCQWSLATRQLGEGDRLSAEGHTADALAEYDESLRILEHLASRDPTNVDWQWGLSVGHVKRADALQVQGDADGALAAYLESLRIAERIAIENPTDDKWRRNLWVVCWDIAALTEKTGRPGSDEWWRRARDVLLDLNRSSYISEVDKTRLDALRERCGVKR